MADSPSKKSARKLSSTDDDRDQATRDSDDFASSELSLTDEALQGDAAAAIAAPLGPSVESSAPTASSVLPSAGVSRSGSEPVGKGPPVGSPSAVVVRLLSEPAQVQAEVERALHRLHARYSQAQRRLGERQRARSGAAPPPPLEAGGAAAAARAASPVEEPADGRGFGAESGADPAEAQPRCGSSPRGRPTPRSPPSSKKRKTPRKR